MIEYDIAKDRSSKELEKLVEDYRRALYLHEYEKRLISQRMPKAIEDTLIASFYAQHQEEFVLRETILQGVLLVVPNGAPNIEELRKRVKDPSNEENLEWVEKFAYQYAVGYELFLDNWKTSTQIYLRMPFETNDLTKQLKRANQIFMQDSTHTYLLQATNMHFEGAAMPMDYARPEIEKIILNERQVGFLQRERQALYEKAIRDKQLKRYEE